MSALLGCGNPNPDPPLPDAQADLAGPNTSDMTMQEDASPDEGDASEPIDLTPAEAPGDPCGTGTPTPAPGQLVARCAIGSPPVIDGKLDDWAFESTTIARSQDTFGQSWGGVWPTNALARDHTLSADVWAAWDRDNLYLAARITDDRVRGAAAGGAPWTADAVELFVDGDRSGEPGHEGARRVVLPVDIKADPAENDCGMSPCMTDWPVTVVTQPTHGGWQLEALIPWASIGGTAVYDRSLGFDLQFDDDDDGEGRDRWLIWYLDPSATGGGMPYDSMILPPMFGHLRLGSR